jgi:hypothetical protein
LFATHILASARLTLHICRTFLTPLVGGYTEQELDAEKRAKFIDQVAQRNQRQRVTCYAR